MISTPCPIIYTDDFRWRWWWPIISANGWQRCVIAYRKPKTICKTRGRTPSNARARWRTTKSRCIVLRAIGRTMLSLNVLAGGCRDNDRIAGIMHQFNVQTGQDQIGNAKLGLHSASPSETAPMESKTSARMSQGLIEKLGGVPCAEECLEGRSSSVVLSAMKFHPDRAGRRCRRTSVIILRGHRDGIGVFQAQPSYAINGIILVNSARDKFLERRL